MGRIVFYKALDTSKTKIIKPYSDEIDMMIKRDLMQDNGVYETVIKILQK